MAKNKRDRSGAKETNRQSSVVDEERKYAIVLNIEHAVMCCHCQHEFTMTKSVERCPSCNGTVVACDMCKYVSMVGENECNSCINGKNFVEAL